MIRLPQRNAHYEDVMQKFLPNERQSRYNWSIAVAAIFVHNCSLDKLHDIVDRGRSEFEQHCRRFLHGHGFRPEDFDRIFNIIKQTASMNPRLARKHVNDLIIHASR